MGQCDLLLFFLCGGKIVFFLDVLLGVNLSVLCSEGKNLGKKQSYVR